MQTGAIPQAGNPARGCHIVQERAVLAGALVGARQMERYRWSRRVQQVDLERLGDVGMGREMTQLGHGCRESRGPGQVWARRGSLGNPPGHGEAPGRAGDLLRRPGGGLRGQQWPPTGTQDTQHC